jgi:DNA-binding response OmpR family regulator
MAMRILIVGNDAVIADGLKEVLKQAGNAVELVKHARAQKILCKHVDAH